MHVETSKSNKIYKIIDSISNWFEPLNRTDYNRFSSVKCCEPNHRFGFRFGKNRQKTGPNRTAATLGRTAHNMFGIPIEITDISVCSLRKTDDKAKMIAQANLIIWDEVPMQHRHVVECVDRSLRDFCNQPDKPFGGITVAWGGDFQQTLPVVEKGSKNTIIEACIQQSPLWQHTTILRLARNMRIEAQDPHSAQFAQWLLDIGQARGLPPDGMFTVPVRVR